MPGLSVVSPFLLAAMLSASTADPEFSVPDEATPRRGWVWAVAPGIGYTPFLGGSTVSIGVFGGPIVAEPDDGYYAAIGPLLQLERSSRGTRYAAGAFVVVRHGNVPVVGLLGAGAGVAYVEIRDPLYPTTGATLRLFGPELHLAFIGRLRIGYLFGRGPAARSTSPAGFVWSVGIGF